MSKQTLTDKEKGELYKSAVENANYSDGTKQTLEEEIKKVIEDILDSISWKALAVGGERWTGVEDECSEEVKDLITLIANRESQIRKEERRKAVAEDRNKIAELCLKSQFANELEHGDGTGSEQADYKWVVETFLAQTEEDLVNKEKSNCEWCDGTGYYEDTKQACPQCDGIGVA